MTTPGNLGILQLAEQIEALRREVAALKGPQLASSSIDNGAMTATVTQDGSQQVTTIVGQQFDGTHGAVVVAGPPPPVPGAPAMSTSLGGVTVTWAGGFKDPQAGFSSPVVAPLDFAGIDVQVSDNAGFPGLGLGDSHGVIPSAAGGQVFVPWPVSGTQLYARLICRSKAGKYSAAGVMTGPTPSGQVQLGDLGFDPAQYSGGTTIYYTVAPAEPDPPAWGFSIGDLWLQETGTSSGIGDAPPVGTPLYVSSRWIGAEWKELQDQGVNTSLATAIAAQEIAASKATVITQAPMPNWSGPAGSAYWIEQPDNITYVWDGFGDWVPYQIGNGAIQPNSLIASNVIATGTVTAALLEANLILGTTLIAGPPDSDHAEMRPDGFHIYRTIATEGLIEVARMATGTDNFFGIVDSTGTQVFGISDVGNMHAKAVTCDSISVAGEDLVTGWINELSSGVVGQVSVVNADISPIASIYGLVEVGAVLVKGRAYQISWLATYDTGVNGAEIKFRIGHTNGTNGNTLTQPAAPLATNVLASPDATWIHSDGTGANTSHTEQGSFIYIPTITSRFRFLLTVELDGGSSTNDVGIVNGASDVPIQLYVVDLGPAAPTSGGYQAGGASLMTGTAGSSPSSVAQQYNDSLIVPSGHWSYKGNLGLRTDTTDVVQGWDPSGFNGDGRGGWNFPIPNISGTVNQVVLFLYCNWAYFNSGGQALISLVADASTASPTTLQTAFNPGTYPKPGGVQVTLPASWYSSFTGKTSIGIWLGAAGTTNELFYVRMDGPSARLAILYTQ